MLRPANPLSRLVIWSEVDQVFAVPQRLLRFAFAFTFTDFWVAQGDGHPGLCSPAIEAGRNVARADYCPLGAVVSGQVDDESKPDDPIHQSECAHRDQTISDARPGHQKQR